MYCQVVCTFPTWRLPEDGNVAALVTEGGEEVGIVVLLGLSLVGSGRRVRLNRQKTQHTLFLGVLWVPNFGHVCGRNWMFSGALIILVLRARACIGLMGASVQAFTGWR